MNPVELLIYAAAYDIIGRPIRMAFMRRRTIDAAIVVFQRGAKLAASRWP